MAFRLQRDELLPDGLRRLWSSEVDSVVRLALRETPLPWPECVHEVRKGVKRLRSLILLGQGGSSSRQPQRAWAALRSLAHLLAPERERVVLRQLLHELHPSALAPGEWDAAWQALGHRRGHPPIEPGDREVERRARVVEQHRDLDWSRVAEPERGHRFLPGVLAVYGQARRAAKASRRTEDPEVVHQWRKSVKYHWFHTQFVQCWWEYELAGRSQALEQLSDLLGAHHDLMRLIQCSMQMPEMIGSISAIEAEVADRQARLLDRAFPLATALFSEKQRPFGRRLLGFAHSHRATLSEPTVSAM